MAVPTNGVWKSVHSVFVDQSPVKASKFKSGNNIQTLHLSNMSGPIKVNFVHVRNNFVSRTHSGIDLRRT